MRLIRFTLLALKCGDYRRHDHVDLDENDARVATFRADARWDEGRRLAGHGVPVERQPVPARAEQLRTELEFALDQHMLKIENAPGEVQEAYARELQQHADRVLERLTRALAVRRLGVPWLLLTLPAEAPPADVPPPAETAADEVVPRTVLDDVRPDDLGQDPAPAPALRVVEAAPPLARDLGSPLAPPPAELPDLPTSGPVADLMRLFAGGAVPKKAEALMGAEDAGIPITGALRAARVADLPGLLLTEIKARYKVPSEDQNGAST